MQSVSRPSGRIIPIVLAVALFMEQMDSTVIATSLPAIAVDLETSPIALKLALTTYFVSLAIFIPISGWMADRFGAKRVFRTAIAVFVLGSLCCAFANTLPAFVSARFIQGMGGAMMTPLARLVLVRSTPKRDLVSAMTWLTIPGLMGPIVGPPVGGFITTFFSWHWIFLINLPIGIAGIVVAGRVLPDFPAVPGPPIDWRGFFLSAVAAAGLVFGLSVISLPALPPAVGAVTLAAGLLSGLLYVRHARRTANPILNLELFRIPTLRAAVTGASLFRIGAGATPFLLPLMFQVGFGLNPLQSGLLTFSSAFGAMSVKLLVTRTLQRFGFRTMLLGGALVGSMLLASHALFTPQTPHFIIIGALVVVGFSRSLFFTSANALIFADIEEKQASQTTALSAVVQQVSIALGVATAGVVLEAVGFFTGTGLSLEAFSIAFVAVALISALAALPFFFLSPDAGQSVSGHGGKRSD